MLQSRFSSNEPFDDAFLDGFEDINQHFGASLQGDVVKARSCGPRSESGTALGLGTLNKLAKNPVVMNITSFRSI